MSVDTWGNERDLYRNMRDYDNPYSPKGTLHFTQVVWASSYRIGCARTKCAGIIAAEYESWYVVVLINCDESMADDDLEVRCVRIHHARQCGWRIHQKRL